ncbi:YeiH family protein [Thalassotalea sp. 1_MG-2023]|uniref:YeiH family protein n=1 Tax=Thalassotalea sp. 1_MG-2023 TaxID=3062680 RepID=UPI0026E38671|nr:YeiH family protein [Thalassotalea sp. 1_MG-2023]MDO6426844.1 YeiH family protein [Thalassotalea sp. 1_MG-2023]
MLSLQKYISSPFNFNVKQFNNTQWWLGILFVTLLAFIAITLSNVPIVQSMKLGTLTLGIVIGLVVGNSIFSYIATHTEEGVDYAKSVILKLGITLFGFRITFDQISNVGWQGLAVDIVMLSMTFLLAIQLGKRVFNLDLQTTILIGAGSSICGAAAILATESVIKSQPYKTSVAVATVVVFGTLSMFLYPFMFEYMSLNEHEYGIFVGSTIHEVAQVVAAANAISETATDSAVIEKMLRVMLLVPFLFFLSIWLNKNKTNRHESHIDFPWFALFFILASGVHSTSWLSYEVSQNIAWLDNILLTIAMVALGLRTHISSIRNAGFKPLVLAFCLFLFLCFGGYAINFGFTKLF